MRVSNRRVARPKQRWGKNLSLDRRKLIALRKQKKKVQVWYSLCTLCQRQLAAKGKPQLQARLTDHYRKEHPAVFSSGGTPVLGHSNAKGDAEHEQEQPEREQAPADASTEGGEDIGSDTREPASPSRWSWLLDRVFG